ncbi:MAG TPA: CrcB family protein [Candidatus Dietzia intestinipullorum]|nr:CrcB family protein [Candidatus Dietzia intestinipullorum]
MNQVWEDAVAIGWVSLGGGVGAALRYAVDRTVSTRWRTRFPLGTFLVNLSGSLLLGLVLGLVAGGGSLAVTLVTTGLLAGYTTFSTASVDAVRLLRESRYVMALTYGLGTLLMTVLAALVGLWIGSA